MKKILLLLLIPFIIQAQIIIAPVVYSSPAGGAFDPSDLNPILDLRWNTGVTADANGKVTAWTDGTYTFNVITDTSYSPLETDSSIYFQPWASDSRKLWIDDATLGTPNEFDFGTGDISIELWVFITGMPSSSIGIFFEKYTNPGWRVGFSANAENNQTSFTLQNSTSSTAVIRNNATNMNGAIHHVVIRLDRNVGATIYEDNTLVNTVTTAFTDMSAEDVTNAIAMTFGQKSLGHIYDVRWYDYVLTEQNIEDLFNFGRTQ